MGSVAHGPAAAPSLSGLVPPRQGAGVQPAWASTVAILLVVGPLAALILVSVCKGQARCHLLLASWGDRELESLCHCPKHAFPASLHVATLLFKEQLKAGIVIWGKITFPISSQGQG
jgi:hypothetical protein